MLLSLFALMSTLVVSSNAFIFDAAKASPVLDTFAQVQAGTLLHVDLDVGKQEKSHMRINGLVLEIHQDNMLSKQHPSLPGANGPHPKMSTGVKNLAIQQEPYYINTDGMQHVDFKDGCWELVWRDGASAGSLICGFHLAEDAKHNGAHFPRGRIYMSFPVWTKETLSEAQEKRLEVEAVARKYIKEKDDFLSKMDSTDNLLMKALHYRSAAEAVEKYHYCGVESYKSVPLDDDVMALQGDLFLTVKGTVWTKSDAFFGPDHTLLGTATTRPAVQKLSDLKP